jgi:hypothetical protein
VNSVVGAVFAGGNVVLTTQDATLPRVDVIVITSAGAVSAIAGTPKALTATSGPVPTAPSSSQLEIARIYVPASGTALSAASITDRRVPLAASALATAGIVKNYKSATQVFTTNTTFADITGAKAATLHLHVRIINGSTAGTVVLQGAQNSSNSTTTFGVGCYMKAERIS